MLRPRTKRDLKGSGTWRLLSFEASEHANTHDDRRGSFHRRDGNRDGTDLIAAVDDFAILIWADVATVALLHDGFLATGNHRQLACQHIVDLLGRRCVRARAATRQEMRDAEDKRLRATHLGAEDTQ